MQHATDAERPTLRTVFDGAVFAFVPKEGHLALHVFVSTPCMPYPLPLISREYLFVRFAWTVFSYGLMTSFLAEGQPNHRAVLRWDQGEMKHTVEDMDQDKCKTVLYAKRAKSSSSSPSEKRRAGSGDAQGAGASVNADADTGGPLTDGECSGDKSSTTEADSDVEDSPPRGRSRKRAIDRVSGAEEHTNTQRARTTPV